MKVSPTVQDVFSGADLQMEQSVAVTMTAAPRDHVSTALVRGWIPSRASGAPQPAAWQTGQAGLSPPCWGSPTGSHLSVYAGSGALHVRAAARSVAHPTLRQLLAASSISCPPILSTLWRGGRGGVLAADISVSQAFVRDQHQYTGSAWHSFTQ